MMDLYSFISTLNFLLLGVPQIEEFECHGLNETVYYDVMGVVCRTMEIPKSSYTCWDRSVFAQREFAKRGYDARIVITGNHTYVRIDFETLGGIPPKSNNSEIEVKPCGKMWCTT